jgi:predicted RND superfamily exporter protein
VKRLSNFIYDHSRLIIGFVIILNLVSLASLYRFSLDTDFLAFFTQGNPKAEAYIELNAKYYSGETISILVEHDGSLLEKETMLEVFHLQNAIREIDGITRVQGFIPEQIIAGTSIITIDEGYIEGQYAALTDFIENKYFMTDQFLTADGKSAVIIASLETDTDAGSVIDSLEALIEDNPLGLSLAGNEVIKNTLWDYLIRILCILPPCAICLILLVFYLVLRNFRLTVLAIVPAALAALWTFGSIFWSGQDLNLVTVISPLFIIVIGSAYGLHYVSHFRDNISKYPDRRELTVATLTMVGTPIFLATITTMAGFASLTWTDVIPMRHMGIFVTLGIAYAGFMALFFLPAVLCRIKLPKKLPPSTDSWLSKLILKASRQRILISVIFAAIVAVSVAYIPGIQVVSDQLMFFKEDSDIRQTYARVEQQFGGAIPLTGEIISSQGQADLFDSEFATRVLTTERELESISGIKSVFSIFDLLQGINRMATSINAYPENPTFTRVMLSQVSSDDQRTWISADGFRMIIRTEGLDSGDIDNLQQFVSEHSDTIRVITGMPMLFDEMNRLVVKSQVQSLALALVLIFIMLWVTLRRITAALAGLLPIAITIGAILGMLVITDFQLNIMTANLSAIAIGVGVDYSIHLISSIYYYRREGMNREESVNAALTTVSQPVLANAFGLAIGFSALFFSPLRIHAQAASVMWVAMVVSSMAALLLVPVFYSGKRRKQTEVKLDKPSPPEH